MAKKKEKDQMTNKRIENVTSHMILTESTKIYGKREHCTTQSIYILVTPPLIDTL